MTTQHPSDTNGIFGSLLCSCFVASLLFGITSTQFYGYLERFSRDPIALKCLACAVWLLETCHQIVFNHVSYTLLVRNYGYPDALLNAPKSIQALFIFSGLVGFIVRGFFIYRIYQFSQSKVLLGILCLLATASLGITAWSLAIMNILKNNILLYATDGQYICYLSLSVAAFTDVTISATTFWLLRKRKTEAPAVGLIGWAGETGFMTSGLLVFSSISAYISRNTCKPLFWRPGLPFNQLCLSVICMAFWIVSHRVYSNSFFAALNGRITLREQGAGSFFAMHRKELSSLVFATFPE
ncbi:hypothetical protein DL96DRAFT_1685173, partial [Flagelloscypha sp. PMI_526]